MLSTVVLSNENQTCRGWEAHTSTGGGGCHDSLYEMCWIGLIFSFLLRIKLSGLVSEYITEVASLTMGIYIIHPMIRKIIVRIIGNTSIFRSIVYWLVTTLCAVVITWIIKKLPSGKRLIKI